MATEAVRLAQFEPAVRRLPVNLDEMTVEQFFDFVQWWAALPSTERQAVLAIRKQTRH